MKTIAFLLLLGICSINVTAQNTSAESFGKTINLGVGVGGYSGYYGYIGHTLPVLHVDYELGIANNFTLAPFVSFYSYRIRHSWDNKYYYYRETVIPIGMKGTYYFDQLLEANADWDFYLAGSLGFAIISTSWDNDYYGDKDYYHRGNPLFLDLHIGAEYHLNNRLGLFLDLSTGVSTIGLAFHQ
jgi:hypothetical protein